MEYCHPYSAMIMAGGTMLDENDIEKVWDDSGTTGNGSATGDFIDLMAPAKGIWTTGQDGMYNQNYYNPIGTSFAAPQAAGLANLIWSYNLNLTSQEVENFIIDGCESFSDYDPALHGAGRINVFNSMALASGDLWTRTPRPGIAGQDNILKAAGATNGATVRFYYGASTGSTAVQGCQGLYLDIDGAVLLGTAQAGSNGAAALNVPVPPSWSQQTVLLQVVEEGACSKSNLVTFTFP